MSKPGLPESLNLEADSRLKSLTHATGELFVNQCDWDDRAANVGLETLDVVSIRKSAKSTTLEPQPGWLGLPLLPRESAPRFSTCHICNPSSSSVDDTAPVIDRRFSLALLSYYGG